jgi:hypothetical protein
LVHERFPGPVFIVQYLAFPAGLPYRAGRENNR